MKKFLIVLLMVSCVILACGKKAPKDAEEKPVTITIWGWDNNVTDITIPAFEAIHPNIKIERVPVTSEELPLKLQQALAAGTDLPDILLAEINQRAVTFAMDIWEDLEQAPYSVKKDAFFQNTLSSMLNTKGQLIAIDQTLAPTGMAYNKNLARKYFGTDDQAAIESMFQTLDDYVTKGAEIAKASGGTVYMFSTPTNVLRWLWYSNPVKLVEADGSINFTAKMGTGIDFLIKLRNAGAVDALLEWSPQESASYTADRHIFYPLPNWGVQYMIKANDPNGQGRWGLCKPSTGPFSWGGTVQGIYKGSKHKAEAWEYIKWFSFTKEGVDVVKKGTDYFSPVKSFYDDPAFVSNVDPFFGMDTGKFFYEELMPNVIPPTFTAYEQYLAETNAAVAAYVMGNKNVTLDQALAKGIEELKTRVPNITVK